MKVIEKGKRAEMCGGCSYIYDVELEEEQTINDVVKSIHKFQEKNNKHGDAYGIYVNNEILESTWIGERPEDNLASYKKRYNGDGNEKVISVCGDGGWFCGISFYISTRQRWKKENDNDYLSI